MLRSARAALPLVLFGVLVPACFSEPGYEGRLCAPSAPCPSGYECDPSGRCVATGGDPDAGLAGDAAPAAPDASDDPKDAGTRDGSAGDSGSVDGGFPDATPLDAGPTDGGADAGPSYFRRVGDLQQGRVWHAAALLADGRVLVTGGFPVYGQWDSVTASAEVFDPTTETWSPVDSLPNARAAHGMAALPDGRVMAAGGTDNFSVSYVDSVDVFDPSTGNWTTVGALQEGRNSVALATLSDGRVIVAGGYPAGTAADIFDPSTNGVSPIAPLAIWRHSHRAITLPDGRAFAMGGASNGFTPSTELYNPATQAWNSGPPMQTGRAWFTLSRLQDGRLLVAGGHDTDNALVFDSVEIYDPTSGIWSPGAPMNHARARHAACVLSDGRVLVTGGDNNGMVLTPEIYDPSKDTWTDLPVEISTFYHTATALPGGRALIVGGLGPQQRETWMFDP